VPEVPQDLVARRVATVRAFIALPASHPLAAHPRVSLGELSQVPFVGYGADRALRALQDEALSAHGLRPKVSHSADSSDTILGFVAAGLGFSLVPSVLERGPEVPGVVAFPLERPKAEFPIWALTKKRTLAHPLIEAALQAL
jgi:DNA-binding transcriptional LysR family regulator